MRIDYIDAVKVRFDNGNEITYNHEIEDSEHTYADFCKIRPEALDVDFDENLRFVIEDGRGFSFGNYEILFFVPCYSEQNGHFNNEIEILYNGKTALVLDAEIIFEGDK